MRIDLWTFHSKRTDMWICIYFVGLKPSYNQCNFLNNLFRPLQAVAVVASWPHMVTLMCTVTPLRLQGKVVSHWYIAGHTNMFKQPAVTWPCIFFTVNTPIQNHYRLWFVMAFSVCWARNQRWSYLQWQWVALSWYCKATLERTAEACMY